MWVSSSMCYQFVRPLLFLLPPECAHRLVLCLLKWAPKWFFRKIPASPVRCFNLEFPNPVGLAPGFAKTGEAIDAMAKLGFGFIEVGGVTPCPQPGNPKPRLFRLSKHQALINRMGFNNEGVDHLVAQLKKIKYRGVLGVNIAKNADTPIENALDDYLICVEKVYPYASYIVINISSPNTLGLRELQAEKYLRHLLSALKDEQQELYLATTHYRPLLIKVAPDLDQDEIRGMAKIFMDYNVDGVIATNTTIARSGLQGIPLASEKGGMSGKPLLKKALHVVRLLHEVLGDAIPIIGVGGIMCQEDAKIMVEAGAKLLQVYTGLIYQGPTLLGELCL